MLAKFARSISKRNDGLSLSKISDKHRASSMYAKLIEYPPVIGLGSLFSLSVSQNNFSSSSSISLSIEVILSASLLFKALKNSPALKLDDESIDDWSAMIVLFF